VIQGLVGKNAFAAYGNWRPFDRQGRTSCFSGEKTLGTYAGAEGDQCVAVGNLLADPEIPGRWWPAFAEDSDRHLAHRLLRALEAGLEAGGEISPVNSAACWSSTTNPGRWSTSGWIGRTGPLGTLRELWKRYEPQIKTFLFWALSPDEMPLTPALSPQRGRGEGEGEIILEEGC